MSIWLIFLTYLEWGVMLTLLGLSVWSIKIMLERRAHLNSLQTKSNLTAIRSQISNLNWQPRKDSESILERLLSGARNENWVRGFVAEQRLIFEKDLSILATLGANAPFIGLFGTVLGIIRAFAALGESAGSASSVMSGISQALYATAAGLFVAIPAVLAFNYFSSSSKRFFAEVDSIKEFFLGRDKMGGQT